MKRLIFITLTFLISTLLSGQTARIIITNWKTNNPIPGATVKDLTHRVSYTTNDLGFCEIDFHHKDHIRLQVSAKSYFSKRFQVKHKNTIVITLIPTNINVSPITIASDLARDLGSTSFSLSNADIASLTKPAFSLDDILSLASALTIIRPQGIYSHSPIITINGMSDVPSRTLIMFDGIRLNKADDGNVNWNMFAPGIFSRVNVGLSSQSTTWGAGAMGSVVNFTRALPQPGLKTNTRLFYGAFNTQGIETRVSYRKPKAVGSFLDIDLFGQKSDGYISVPDSLQLPGVEYIPTSLEEVKLNILSGYNFRDNSTIKFYFNAFADKRSMGIKIKEDNIVKHPTFFVATKYSRHLGKLLLETNIHMTSEHYFKTIEKLKRGNYSLIYVNSVRKDAGANLLLHGSVSQRLSMSAGIISSWGSVLGKDVYQSSTDVVINNGRILSFDYFFNLSWVALKNKNLLLSAGSALNMSYIIKPSFIIDNPTEATDFMFQYTGEHNNNRLFDWSGKLALTYYLGKHKFTIGYNSGYTLPTLDDLTRSGFMRLGFKLANPLLKPEKIYDLYTAYTWTSQKIMLKANLHHKIGYDFMYYVETGDYLFGGRKPVIQKQNVSHAIIDLVDLNANYTPCGLFSLYTSYTYTRALITSFDKHPQYNGKKITYTPEHSLVVGIQLRTKYVYLSGDLRYYSMMYTDVANTQTVPSRLFIDTKAKVYISPHTRLELSVENITNKQYLIYTDQISLGRFWLITLQYSL